MRKVTKVFAVIVALCGLHYSSITLGDEEESDGGYSVQLPSVHDLTGGYVSDAGEAVGATPVLDVINGLPIPDVWENVSVNISSAINSTVGTVSALTPSDCDTTVWMLSRHKRKSKYYGVYSKAELIATTDTRLGSETTPCGAPYSAYQLEVRGSTVPADSGSTPTAVVRGRATNSCHVDSQDTEETYGGTGKACGAYTIHLARFYANAVDELLGRYTEKTRHIQSGCLGAYANPPTLSTRPSSCPTSQPSGGYGSPGDDPTPGQCGGPPGTLCP